MIDTLHYLSIALPVLILIRLVQQGLWRLSPYSGFALFLMVGLVRDLVLLKPDYETTTYSLLWKCTLPVLLIAQIGAGLSTYSAISRMYSGLGRFAIWLFAICLLAAALAGLVLLPVEIHRIGAAEAELRVLFLVQRWVATVLAGGLMLAVAYLQRFPAPLRQVPRNIKVHAGCVAAYFSSYAVLYALENAYKLGEAQWAVMAQLTAVCLIYCVWAVGLSREGQLSKPWPALDQAVFDMIDARYRAARNILSQAAGNGRR
jgi:ethanolamine transporter EutH